jgi:hypothetical protein
MKLSALVFLIAISCLPLHAQMTVMDYRRTMRDGSPAAVTNLKGYVFGAASGIQAANVFAGLTKQVKLYCAPPNQTITGDDYISIRNRAITANAGMPGLADMPISMLLMQGLMTAYPCPAH